ncbi:MAG: ABC transporter substrate-binding protein [Alkaliphilus sp.]
MRSKILLLVLMLIFTSFFSMIGCAPVEEEPAVVEKADGEKEEEEEVEVIELTYLSLAWQEEVIEAKKDIIDTWNEKNPNIQVKYVQGDWGSIHDFMITSFAVGNVPSIFHYYSTPIVDFAGRDFLADLTPLITDEMKNDVFEEAWASVRLPDEKIYGIPFLWESRITLYNKDIFDKANITPPTIEDPWTWDEMREVAKELTVDKDNDGKIDQWGAGFGLRKPAGMMLNLSLGFGGGFVKEEDGKHIIEVGEAEKNLMRTLKAMLYEDKSTTLDGIGLSGTKMLPGFYEGKWAMIPVIGVWARHRVTTDAPADFNWGVLPPLKAITQAQGASTQTLSIPKDAPHQEEAMQFINFFLDTQNMAKLAQGDWLFPTRKSSIELPEFQTEEHGWDIATASVEHLKMGPWQLTPGFAEFQSRVMNPVLVEFFHDRLTVDQAAERIEEEGNNVLSEYQ